MMKKDTARKIFVSLVILGISQLTFAQSYFNAFGVRIANGSAYRTAGLTYQQKVLKDFTIEGIAQTDFSKNSTFHALFEYHKPIITKRLNYYVGAGLMSGREHTLHSDSLRAYSSAIFGADLIAGLEITLMKFTISLDYKPNFNITGREKWFQDQVAVSVRAVILSGHQHAKKVKAKEKAKAKIIRQNRMKQRNSNPLIKKRAN
ncbi:MAG: hypothetical protein ACERKD_17980 [Prolixibacteraceae bacterium]